MAAQLEEWVAFSSVERAMARRMERVASVPLASEWTRVDVAAALAKVDDLRAAGVQATFSTLVVSAAARGLAEYPVLACKVDYDAMARRIPAAVNVGVAVASDRGLVLPVVRDVVGKPLRVLAAELHEAVEAARAGSRDSALYAGGHFSITNMGNLPVYGGAPLPNTPQVAILGVGGAWDAPVIRDGAVVASKLVQLTITIDHRALDGITAGRFLVAVRDALLAPDSLDG